MAQVRQTDADVFLSKHCSIFAYHPPSRMLLWACYDHGAEHWELHKNGFLVGMDISPKRVLTHYELLNGLDSHASNIVDNVDHYIRGRISPDKGTIYIHDLCSRTHTPFLERERPTHIKNTLRKIAMYMTPQTTSDLPL